MIEWSLLVVESGAPHEVMKEASSRPAVPQGWCTPGLSGNLDKWPVKSVRGSSCRHP